MRHPRFGHENSLTKALEKGDFVDEDGFFLKYPDTCFWTCCWKLNGDDKSCSLPPKAHSIVDLSAKKMKEDTVPKANSRNGNGSGSIKMSSKNKMA